MYDVSVHVTYSLGWCVYGIIKDLECNQSNILTVLYLMYFALFDVDDRLLMNI